MSVASIKTGGPSGPSVFARLENLERESALQRQALMRLASAHMNLLQIIELFTAKSNGAAH